MDYDVAIVGIGRVGLPLALCFADHALDTGSHLALSNRIADAAQATHIVITLGTPSFSHIEIDISQIRCALDELSGALRPGQSLVLRSTVAPGTTDYVAAYLRRHTSLEVGTEIHVAHAPERIAAGRFIEEIHTLPCIVGGIGPASGAVVGELFSVFGAPGSG